MTRHQTLACLLIAGMATAAPAQTSLKSLIPTVRQVMKNDVNEDYTRVDNNLCYTFSSAEVPKDSVPAQFIDKLRAALKADMETASESNHYINRDDGRQTEDFVMRNDMMDTKSMVTLGDIVSCRFSQNILTARPTANISVPFDEYLEAHFGAYAKSKGKKTFAIRPVGDNTGKTPCLMDEWVVPADKAAEADSDIRQWLVSAASHTSFDIISLFKMGISVNFSGNHIDSYDIYRMKDGTLEITKFYKTDDTQAGPPSTPTTVSDSLTVMPVGDNGLCDVWHMQPARQQLPLDIHATFSLERRSDMTVMHVRRKLVTKYDEAWADTTQTFLVDEDTQTHYKARGASPKELWGKMIRICGMDQKTIAIDVVFPPLPIGVTRFSVWGMERLGVMPARVFYMKRDGDLYLEK